MIKPNDIIKNLQEALYIKKTLIKPETLLTSLARDSMDIIEVIAILQNEYGISVKPADLQSLKTVDDLVKFVQSHAKSDKKSSITESL